MDSQAKAVEKAGIDLRLNVEVTPEYAESVGADVIISALGARPVKPNIAGIDGKNVLAAEEAYIHPEKTGDTVAILGGGLVGVELGIYLATLGRRVTIIEMLDKISDGGNFLHVLGLKREISRLGIDLYLNTKAKEITELGVTARRRAATDSSLPTQSFTQWDRSRSRRRRQHSVSARPNSTK